MNTEIAAYNPTKAALVDLAARYKGLVFEVTTPKGMAEAKAAYKDINQHSIALEAARKREKEESLAYGRWVDSEAKRISEQLDVLRLPIKDQIETETKREERERQAAIKAEQDRILAEQAAAKAAEEKRMAEERAELARQREAMAAEQRARDEEARQARLKIEQEQREAREKIEAEERAARAAREEADRIARQAREAEEAKLKAERDRIEAERRAAEDAARKLREAEEAKAAAERRAKEEAERKEREAREAVDREAKRKADELLGAAAMLKTFKERYGHLPQYAIVIDAINALEAI